MGVLLKAGAVDKLAAVQKYTEDHAIKGALAGYATDPEGTISKITAIDPERGTKLAAAYKAQRGAADQQAYVNALKSHDLVKANEIATNSGNPELVSYNDKLHEHAGETASVMAQSLNGLKAIPYDQRKAAIEQLTPQLTARGIDPKQIAGFDPTDQNIGLMLSQAMTLKEQLDANKPLIVPQGSNIFMPDSAGGGAASGAPTAASAGSPATASAPAADGAATTAPVPISAAAAHYGTIAQQQGADSHTSQYIAQLAQRESRGDPNAQNGSSTGGLQLQPATFSKANPGGDIHNPADQVKASIALSQQDRQTLQAHGITPSDDNAYVMYQQGAAGGLALLTAPPEVGAVAALTPLYVEKYGAKAADVARQAVVNNGGTADMTAGQFAQHIRDYWNGGSNAPSAGNAGVPAAASQAAPSIPGYHLAVQGQSKQVHPSTPEELKALGLDPADIKGAQTDATGKVTFAPDTVASEHVALTPQAIDFFANTALSQGSIALPSFGSRGSAIAMKALVANREAELAAEKGVTGEGMAAAKIGLHADQANLTQMEKLSSVTDVREKTASQAMDYAASIVRDKGGTTRWPIINKALISWNHNTGNPQTDAFISRLGTAVDEYAQVISGGTGGTPATDGVRAEARRRISEAASPEQLAAVIDSMKQEMSFRSANLRDGVDTIKSRVGSIGKPAVRVPNPGDIVRGFKFKGGNPADKNSWVRVQ